MQVTGLASHLPRLSTLERSLRARKYYLLGLAASYLLCSLQSVEPVFFVHRISHLVHISEYSPVPAQSSTLHYTV